jgi:hypothetical protein
LVDTLASGASDRKVVEVQVLSWAPIKGARHRCVVRFDSALHWAHFTRPPRVVYIPETLFL